ncbi:MAG: DUF2817 domain-containing protein, partial [Alphaproteobacteria bacterium]|nr:DUF2817 domain-containing protein [Alphaproteobacteria bacterium]
MEIFSCFSRDYPEARARFLDAVETLDAPVMLDPVAHPLTGPTGEALSTDTALVGDPEADRVLVLISGT